MVKKLSDPGTTEINGIRVTKSNGDVSEKKTKTHYLNFGEEDQMEISGYRSNDLKKYLTWTLYVITLGILRLIHHWYPQWQLYATHSECPLEIAERVLILAKYKEKFKSFFVKDVETIEAGDHGLRKSDSAISVNGLIFSKGEERKLTVYLRDGTRKKSSRLRIIRCKKLMYVWDEEKRKFIKLSGLDKGITNAEFHTHDGLSEEEQGLRRVTYGTNEINVPVQSILTLLVLEALTPFYIFQLFSLILWLIEKYYYYTIAIAVMSVVGITTSIIQTRRNQKNLRGTVNSVDKVQVNRGGTFEEVPTTELVPGDLFVIPSHGCEMPCDALLLNGNCIVNESMLTGESVPVTKTALPNNNKLFDAAESVNHTLFCGTKVIQTRYYGTENVMAVVIRTGYLTSKGQLVRSIMYPPPADFKFDQDSYKFIMILAGISFCGFIYTIFSKSSRSIAAFDVVIKALDLITIAIPPALPAAMTIGKIYALSRLKAKQIYCINSRVINVSGSINCICFDKTGTLTEDGLDMWGVVPIEDGRIEKPIRDAKTMNKDSLLFQGMLTCHSMTLIDNELCGDPLDVKMFESTGWVLEEPTVADTSKYDLLVPTIVKENTLDKANQEEIGLIQQYQFSSTLQRMSVICRRFGSSYFEVFAKGSPEMIISLSRPETVPEGIFERLQQYTQQGYRVIGMGTKVIEDVPFHKIPKLQREEVECDLTFVGLIILENRLKPETGPIIKVLKNAGMKIVMVTGDNIQTAVSVARECGIIQPGYSVIDVITTRPTKSELAQIRFEESGTKALVASEVKDIEQCPDRKYHFVVSGNTWADLNRFFPDLIPKIITRGVVFARMSGNQKQQLIEELQNLGYYVAMCGDGANDCGALKAANVGISLSEAESSVASPFTSKEPNISCCAEVVREGRAALQTSFGVFKLMICYSLTEFASCIVLYGIDSNLTSLQFLFIDICLILNFASFFGKTQAHPHLYKKPPMTSLLSVVPFTSLILFMLIAVAVQITTYHTIRTFDWYKPFFYDPNKSTYFTCFENYAVFCVSMFQYITMAIVFSKGKPYRRPIYTNYFYMFTLTLMVAICTYITVEPAKWIIDALELEVPPKYDGRLFVLIMGAITFAACFIAEDILVDVVMFKMIKPRFHNIDKSSKKYLRIEKELKENSVWPNARSADVGFAETNETRYRGGGVVNHGYTKDVEMTKC